MKDLKVAIVTEYMTAIGGSDRIIESLLKIFPDAEIYTASFEKKNYSKFGNKVYTPKFFNWFLRKSLGRRVTVFLPFLFEQFDLRGYDLVVSVSAGASKGVITMPDQPHIGIICTPPRHQWDGDINIRGSMFKKIYLLGSKIISSYIRVWDVIAAKRIDYIVSISKFIKRKVYKRYRRDSVVIYPGIKDFWFEKVTEGEKEKVRNSYKLPEDFLLVVSRLYDYKRVDWAIRAAINSLKPLVIAGNGPDLRFLQKLAKGHDNIIFLPNLNDNEVRCLYNMAEVLLFCGIEDFGLIPVEAMASGTPVFAYNTGGVTETVENAKSGYYFESESELLRLVNEGKWKSIKPEWCIMRAQKFTEYQFISKITKYIKDIYEKERSN
ncbi:MAG: hypothetical protein UT34_C0002G0274 [candidate division WS6 bacterium GW2011_GWF2_39_15]|uniref:Glycosyl transferase family 1 domain-containing protein n=1 Tax=candidate division WS6 bacterium GW2011_GWF2_39_15 TaxID=1619100 RepID=A0A0G0QVX2_9BACT|nr:MAG: hypothetical protein UT34_C0002G0274 [candidate division WS6 bacterium GW2011_GWF2_39_15]